MFLPVTVGRLDSYVSFVINTDHIVRLYPTERETTLISVVGGLKDLEVLEPYETLLEAVENILYNVKWTPPVKEEPVEEVEMEVVSNPVAPVTPEAVSKFVRGKTKVDESPETE